MSKGISEFVMTILFVVISYFVYGQSISAALGMFLLIIGSGLTTLLSIIPFVGIFITWFVNTQYTYPGIMGFTGMYPTWITNILFWWHTIIGAIVTIITSFAVLVTVKKW